MRKRGKLTSYVKKNIWFKRKKQEIKVEYIIEYEYHVRLCSGANFFGLSSARLEFEKDSILFAKPADVAK